MTRAKGKKQKKISSNETVVFERGEYRVVATRAMRMVDHKLGEPGYVNDPHGHISYVLQRNFGAAGWFDEGRFDSQRGAIEAVRCVKIKKQVKDEGLCQVCHQEVGLNHEGKIMAHGGKVEACLGTGYPPMEGAPALIPMDVDANYEGRLWTVNAFCPGTQEYCLIRGEFTEDGVEHVVWVHQDELIRRNPRTAALEWRIPVETIKAVSGNKYVAGL